MTPDKTNAGNTKKQWMERLKHTKMHNKKMQNKCNTDAKHKDAKHEDAKHEDVKYKCAKQKGAKHKGAIHRLLQWLSGNPPCHHGPDRESNPVRPPM